jgi:sugar phosphate permease
MPSVSASAGATDDERSERGWAAPVSDALQALEQPGELRVGATEPRAALATGLCSSHTVGAVSADAVAVLPPEVRRWRWRIFASTWLCYAGFYFCRKPFYIAKAALGAQLHFDATALGLIGSAYLGAYTLGQFAAGALGNRLGPRLVLLTGMALSVAANVGFGLTNSLGTFVALMALNGAVQATGWSNTVGTMAHWFRRAERGTVMGFWATNFQVGGVAANTLAAWALGQWGFRYSFFTGSLVLLGVWAVFFFHQRDRPQDVGLPPVEDPLEPADGSPGLGREAWKNVLLVGAFYFFVKFIRYSLWSWAPYFLQRNFGLKGDDAGYLSTLFDLAGIAGVVVTGLLSDKLFESRRAGVSLAMMLVMVASCVALSVGGGASVGFFAVCLALVGFTLYGPDALMSGAGAMDIGSRRGAVLAAGVINGMGSLGSIVQELLIGRLYDSGSGQLGPIFAVLLGASAAASALIGVVWVRNRLGRSNV